MCRSLSWEDYLDDDESLDLLERMVASATEQYQQCVQQHQQQWKRKYNNQ